MKTIINLSISLFFIGLMTAQEGKYDRPETKQLVEKMINAHGGMNIWENAPSMSFHHNMVNPQKPDEHWLSLEAHEQGRRRIYQEWPNDKATLGFDGNEIWTKNWKRGNPPSMMAGISYFFINTVWMTQDIPAQLALKEDTKVPFIKEGVSYKTVRLTFKGSSEYEYFDMYIDPSTYVLKGIKYTVVSKELMKLFNVPKETKFLGPLYKVYKEYKDVDGLKLTTRYDTYTPSGQVYGIHTVENYSIKKPFDASKIINPEKNK
tara:strand:- start:4779 stop:5564 length:786 start_codon:yes stop_codon:yes gene_type:complete